MSCDVFSNIHKDLCKYSGSLKVITCDLSSYVLDLICSYKMDPYTW